MEITYVNQKEFTCPKAPVGASHWSAGHHLVSSRKISDLVQGQLLKPLFQWNLHMKFNSKLLKTWKITYVNHKGFTSASESFFIRESLSTEKESSEVFNLLSFLESSSRSLIPVEFTYVNQ